MVNLLKNNRVYQNQGAEKDSWIKIRPQERLEHKKFAPNALEEELPYSLSSGL
jgi:hypothetical protein